MKTLGSVFLGVIALFFILMALAGFSVEDTDDGTKVFVIIFCFGIAALCIYGIKRLHGKKVIMVGGQDYTPAYLQKKPSGEQELQTTIDELLERYNSGDLPIEYQPRVMMKQGEICHKLAQVKLYEFRTKTKYVGGSMGASFRVAKGVTLRAGSFKGEPIRTKNLQEIDTGYLHVTNQRVIYTGQQKSVTYPLGKILDIRQDYSDSVQFLKENDNSPKIFSFPDKWDLIEVMLLSNVLVSQTNSD